VIHGKLEIDPRQGIDGDLHHLPLADAGGILGGEGGGGPQGPAGGEEQQALPRLKAHAHDGAFFQDVTVDGGAELEVVADFPGQVDVPFAGFRGDFFQVPDLVFVEVPEADPLAGPLQHGLDGVEVGRLVFEGGPAGFPEGLHVFLLGLDPSLAEHGEEAIALFDLLAGEADVHGDDEASSGLDADLSQPGGVGFQAKRRVDAPGEG